MEEGRRFEAMGYLEQGAQLAQPRAEEQSEVDIEVRRAVYRRGSDLRQRLQRKSIPALREQSTGAFSQFPEAFPRRRLESSDHLRLGAACLPSRYFCLSKALLSSSSSICQRRAVMKLFSEASMKSSFESTLRLLAISETNKLLQQRCSLILISSLNRLHSEAV